MNISRVTILCASIFSFACAASDAQTQIAVLRYLMQSVHQMQSPTMVAKAQTIFQDQMLIDMIAKRIKETKKWIAQQETNKKLAGSAKRIQEAVDRINRMITLFRDKVEMIKTDENTRKIYRKMVKNFSQDRDTLKAEVATLDTMGKQKLPGLADVLKAYAYAFVAVAQQAITDFARIDATLFAKEKEMSPKIMRATQPLGAGHSPETSVNSDDWSDWDSSEYTE